MHETEKGTVKDCKGDNKDEKANISRTSKRANTRVGAMERGCRELSFEPQLGWNGGGTHLGQIWRLSKTGVTMMRQRVDGSE